MSDPIRARPNLNGACALVTGASRGVGRGIAQGLYRTGATVYSSGRSIETSDLDDGIVRVACDHTDDQSVGRLFERIATEQGRLDVLVNNAWGGYENMVEDGQFTWSAPFWAQPLWRWAAMMDVGVRGAFVASQHAARLMVPRRRGLIVNISQWAAQLGEPRVHRAGRGRAGWRSARLPVVWTGACGGRARRTLRLYRHRRAVAPAAHAG